MGGIKLIRSFINSIPNKKDLDKLRKQQDYQYYQSAWHGSPHDFDEFDLGAIGTGEGNQAHGWGLYFAKDKKVSKLYKEVLSKEQGSNKSSLFKVEIPNETELLVSIPQAVSTFTLSFSPLFGQRLEICGPHRHFVPLLPHTLRRLPRAVGAVATLMKNSTKIT